MHIRRQGIHIPHIRISPCVGGAKAWPHYTHINCHSNCHKQPPKDLCIHVYKRSMLLKCYNCGYLLKGTFRQPRDAGYYFNHKLYTIGRVLNASLIIANCEFFPRSQSLNPQYKIYSTYWQLVTRNKRNIKNAISSKSRKCNH